MGDTNSTKGSFHAAGVVPERAEIEGLGCYEWLLGIWEIRYPDEQGMIRENYFERLELGPDLIYHWDPTPLWANRTGFYGVTPWEEGLKLYFEQRRSNLLRGNHLLPIEVSTVEGPELCLNWQRTFNNAVVFSDRVFVARRPQRLAHVPPGSFV